MRTKPLHRSSFLALHYSAGVMELTGVCVCVCAYVFIVGVEGGTVIINLAAGILIAN